MYTDPVEETVEVDVHSVTVGGVKQDVLSMTITQPQHKPHHADHRWCSRIRHSCIVPDTQNTAVLGQAFNSHDLKISETSTMANLARNANQSLTTASVIVHIYILRRPSFAKQPTVWLSKRMASPAYVWWRLQWLGPDLHFKPSHSFVEYTSACENYHKVSVWKPCHSDFLWEQGQTTELQRRLPEVKRSWKKMLSVFHLQRMETICAPPGKHWGDFWQKSRAHMGLSEQHSTI